MALRFSTGVVNNIASGMGWGDVLKNGIVKVYSGSQPTTANDSATGTLLAQFSTGIDGAFTGEIRATGTVDFTSATGNCTALTVGGTSIISGTVTYSTPTALAAAVAANINAHFSYPDYYAVVGGTVVGGVTYGSDAKIVYIIAPKNSGTSLNGLTVSCTVASGSITAVVMGAGTTTSTAGVAAVTCLNMTYPAVAGIISKSGTWQDTAANASGTAGWFRFLCTPNYDDGTTNLTAGNSDYLIMRIDGTVGSSGADMTISNTSIVLGASQTINQFDLTIA